MTRPRRRLRLPLALLAPSQVALIMGLVIGVFFGVAPRTFAAEAAGRVVVVVDSAGGVGLDGDAVRRAIGDELGAPVLGPSDPDAGDAANILVVSVDKTTIRMTLRGRSPAATMRTIPASTDRSVRLHEIAWLAGNLLRDQVSPIVASRPAAKSEPAAPAPAPAPPAPTAPAPAVGSAPVVAPARVAGAGRGDAVIGPPPAETVAAAGSEPPGASHPTWILAALAGPTIAFAGGGDTFVSATYQIDLQRRSASRGLILGLGLQLGSGLQGPNVHLVGFGGLIGWEWRWSRLFIDLDGGVGVEIVRVNDNVGTFNGIECPSTGCASLASPVLEPLFYTRVASTAGVAVTTRLDVVVRLNAHLSSDGLILSYAGATAGLRFRL